MSGSAQSVFAVIVGAGPAGLSAAYYLTKAGKTVVLLESDPDYVGGVSRTVRVNEFLFDIGGHRFFSKSREVEDFWNEVLPGQMLLRSRASRIFYRGKYFSYPLRAMEALWRLGVAEAVVCLASYFRAKVAPHARPETVEGWLTNSFGRRLYETFFKAYTEKVWGIPCSEISSDWTAQRIKGLSVSALLWRRKGVKSLIESFRYPPRGPGMLWEACAEKVRDQGGAIHMGFEAKRYSFDAGANEWTVWAEGKVGVLTVKAEHVISSAPLGKLVGQIEPALPAEARDAAAGLKYRDFLLVALVLKGRELFPDNWIYVHDPAVRVGRVQNFKAWSPEMVPDASVGSYGAEYFCQRGDETWSMPDEELIRLAQRELREIGLLQEQELMFGHVIRQARAYPIYGKGYAGGIDLIRQSLSRHAKGIYPVGRNGMHRYNNQDHAIMTAKLTAENILAGRESRDPWKVNQDAEYIEETSAK